MTVLGGTASASAVETTSSTTSVVGEQSPTATPLSWAPPELTAPITVYPSVTKRDLRLDVTKDYIVKMPAQPLSVVGGLVISGGRNVVLIGGHVEVPEAALATGGHALRGLYLKGQTGTIHVEGLRISGAGLGEGINLDQRLGARVQLQNVRVDTVTGSYSGNHADVIQTWAGPRQLLIDGLSGHTTYQGFFMLPTQQWTTNVVEPEVFDLRRVDLHGTDTSGYMMWRDKLAWPLKVSDVWVAPKNPLWRDGFLYPKGTGAGTEAWPYVNVGTPPQGEFVPAGTAGVAYTSPGYAPAEPEPVVTEPVVTEPVVVAEPVHPAVGVLDAVTPVAGGLRVIGWAADRDTTEPLAVDVVAAGRTHRVLADLARPDVQQTYPDLGASTGFDTVVPLPVGAHEVCVTAVNVGSGTDTALGCRTATVADTTAPVFAGGPEVLLRSGTVSTTGLVPVTAQWSVTDDVALRDTGLTSPVTATYSATTTRADVAVGTGTQRWTAVASDQAGNVGTASSTRSVALLPEASATLAGQWKSVSGSHFLGGKALRATRAGVSMSHSFTGRGVAWVASTGTDSGRAHVYVDGVKVRTVDLLATSGSHRQVVFTQSWSTAGAHTVKVVVEGTSGRPTVTSDGFVTLG